MNSIILSGLAAGAITVLLCTSSFGEWLQSMLRKVSRKFDSLLSCCFCTSWWVSIAMIDEFTIKEWAATVALANFTVLMIHMAMGSIEETPDVQEMTTSDDD